jgi:hypothetical protein
MGHKLEGFWWEPGANIKENRVQTPSVDSLSSFLQTMEIEGELQSSGISDPEVNRSYRLYRWRFVGLAAMVCRCSTLSTFTNTYVMAFSDVSEHWRRTQCDMVWTHSQRQWVMMEEKSDEKRNELWIAAFDYKISLDQVNWLSNVAQLVFIPMALITPYIQKAFGMRITVCILAVLDFPLTLCQCIIASILLTVGSWIRYASTPHSLSPTSSLVLLLIGQVRSLHLPSGLPINRGLDYIFLFPTDVHHPWLKIFRALVRPKGKSNRYNVNLSL